MVFHWSLSDCKSSKVSLTLLSILVDLNNAVVWMLSTRLLISKTSRPRTNPLVTVPSVPITIVIVVTFLIHSFFSSRGDSQYLSFFPLSFSFIQWSARTAKSIIRQVLFLLFLFFFFFFWLSVGLVVWLKLVDPFLSQNPKEFCESHFLGQILDCAYTICSYGQI